MDVTCPRCQTDYEFDDALVSERGTTVKCTNCGHQFRVFRPRAAEAGDAAPEAWRPEVWRIERPEGEPLELRSLVELQRAIRAGRVLRTHTLQRGDGPARKVGDIPELEPFFPTTRQEGRQEAKPSTLPLPPVADQGDRRDGSRPSQSLTPAYGRPTVDGTIPPSAIAPPVNRPALEEGRSHTPIGISAYSPGGQPVGPFPPSSVPPSALTVASAGRLPQPDTQYPTKRLDEREASGEAQTDASTGGPQPPDFHPAPPPPPRHPSEQEAADIDGHSPPDARDDYDSLFEPPLRRRRGGATMLVLLVVLAGVGVLGATVGRPYVRKVLAYSGFERAPSAVSNAVRLQRELAAGERALRDGDFMGAREAYVRATVLDEPAVAAWDGLCSAESELAVNHWIAGLSTDSALEREQGAAIGGAAGRSCARWAQLARSTAEGAKKVSDDLRFARAIAAQGDGGGVRIFIGAHPGDARVDALTLLADATKKDREALKAAATAVGPALARVDLTALVTPSDLALAAFVASIAGPQTRAEDAISELARRAPRHPLLEILRASAGEALGGAATTSGAIDAIDASAPTTASGQASDASPAGPNAGDRGRAANGKPGAAGGIGGAANAGAGGGGEESSAGDYRSLNERAHKALVAGDTTKAETLFRAALAQHPGDTDANFGLGQIASSRGDHAGAVAHYKAVLDVSSGFASARLALADEQWALGQKADAVANYNLYLDRATEGAGAARARERVGKAAKDDSPSPGAAPTPSATTTPSTTTSATPRPSPASSASD